MLSSLKNKKQSKNEFFDTPFDTIKYTFLIRNGWIYKFFQGWGDHYSEACICVLGRT